MLSRRSFLVSAGAGVAAGSLRSTLVSAAGAKIPLGIQLFVVRAEMDKDFEGTLRKVHALGYREIEFAGYYGKNAAELAKLMKAIGFTLVSTHIGADDIAANPDSVIADAKTLGLEYIICSSPMTRKPEKAKLEWAKKLDALDLDDWKANAEGARHRVREWRAPLLLRAGAAVHATDPRVGEDERRVPVEAHRLGGADAHSVRYVKHRRNTRRLAGVTTAEVEFR